MSAPEEAAPAGSGTPPRFGREIRCLSEVGSTNDVVLQEGLAGASEGLVVVAERQTAGRGRHGRTWISPPRTGLWFSVLLRPRLAAEQLPAVGLVAALALCWWLEADGLRTSLKWPNDVIGRQGKIAGVLPEARWPGPLVVLGVGVNLRANVEARSFTRGYPVSSVEEEGGRAVDRDVALRSYLQHLETAWGRLERGGFAGLVDECTSRLAFVGCPVVARIGGREVRGQVERLDAEGRLVLQTASGPLPLVAGEVSVARTEGETPTCYRT